MPRPTLLSLSLSCSFFLFLLVFLPGRSSCSLLSAATEFLAVSFSLSTFSFSLRHAARTRRRGQACRIGRFGADEENCADVFAGFTRLLRAAQSSSSLRTCASPDKRTGAAATHKQNTTMQRYVTLRSNTHIHTRAHESICQSPVLCNTNRPAHTLATHVRTHTHGAPRRISLLQSCSCSFFLSSSLCLPVCVTRRGDRQRNTCG